MGKLIVLSGPSCVGKGPLYAALKKFYPEVTSQFSKLVLYNDRAPRPGEVDGVDYHFKQTEYIERLDHKDDFLVFKVRSDLQAVDISELKKTLTNTDVFFEGNPYLWEKMKKNEMIKDVFSVSVFLSPLSKEEFEYLNRQSVDVEDFVADIMRRKLLRRTKNQKQILSSKDLQDIEIRATSAYAEIKLAYQFDFVLVNHDGEDSENWNAFYYPVGDARRTLLRFADILIGKKPLAAEKWHRDLLPD